MIDNQSFTAQQDQIIRDLYQRQNIKKWGMIARVLTQDYGRPRNAKQCRDRYQKYLDPYMLAEWTVQEQRYLYKLHDQIGNKWAIIAQKFPGKTDNCVKNHFYSKMRKALRHLNKVIKNNFRKEFKELKIGVLYKIIEALEDRFKQTAIIDHQIIQKCYDLKYALLQYADLPDEKIGQDIAKEYKLIKQICSFGKCYKKKTKRERRNSNQGNDLVKFPNFQKVMKAASENEDSQSSYSQVFSHLNSSQEQSNKSQGKPLVIIEQDIRQSMNSKYSYPPCHQNKSEKMQEELYLRGSQMSIESNNSVQQILKDKGALQAYNIPFTSKQSYSHYSSNKSQSERADMFGDDLRFSGGLKQLNEIEEEQPAEQNIFRSQR